MAKQSNAKPNVGTSADVRSAESLATEALNDAQASVDALEHVAAEMDAAAVTGEPAAIDMLSDVDLNVSIELGRTDMLVEDVLKLSEGSVVELDKLAGDPVDVYVNNRLVARGEVLVLNDNFCIRVSEIVANLEEEAQEVARQQGG